jgi:uncharacterized protein
LSETTERTPRGPYGPVSALRLFVLWCALLAFFPLSAQTRVEADDFAPFDRYSFGALVETVEHEPPAGDTVQGRMTRIDPETLAREVRTFSVEWANGEIMVSLLNGEQYRWTTPYRLEHRSVLGLRRTYRAAQPIIILRTEFIAANRAVLRAHLAATPSSEVLLVAALEVGGPYVVPDRTDPAKAITGSREDGELRPMSFDKADLAAATIGLVARTSRRWAGGRETAGLYRRIVPFDLLIGDGNRLLGWQISGSEPQVAITRGYETLTPQASWQDGSASPAAHRTVLDQDLVHVLMRDGVRLAASVWLPADGEGKPLPGPFATVLVRTPYGRKAFDSRPIHRFTARGFAVVSQDVRGRFDSEGEFAPLYDERQDGSDTLDWIAAQPWSDGKVGMVGRSYLGFTQWQAASTGNPHLKAMISYVPAAGGFIDMPYINGAFMSGILDWAIAAQAPDQYGPSRAKNLNALLSTPPLIDADIRAVGRELPLWRQWLRHQTFDQFWQAGSVDRHAAKIKVPVMHITGWYDDVIRATMHYHGLTNARGAGDQQLVIGPWPHAGNETRQLGDIDFGPDATWHGEFHAMVRWFDRWLKGRINGVENDPAVLYFNTGENKWRTASAWPLPQSTTTRLYLRSMGAAHTPDDGGRLSAAPASRAEAPDHYQHDPASPAPHLVDIRTNQLAMPEDYSEVERRSDTLEYSTDLLESPLQVSGAPAFILHASSSARDTDWIVRLTDVHPDGRSIHLADGVVRASYRDGPRRPSQIEPNKPYRYSIPLTWVSHRFAVGHRLRITIASAAAGWLHVNSNTGNDFATDTKRVVATQTIFHDPDRPSHLVLPTVAAAP